jgi:hypothetical protein
MAGCKGLVIIDPESTVEQFYIKIRPSMKKFDCDDWDLDICEASQPSMFHFLFYYNQNLFYYSSNSTQ